MAKRMEDGERRVIKPPLGKYRSSTEQFEVIAFREDCDTPYVILKNHKTGEEHQLTDGGAEDLAQRIFKALSILPSSK